MPILARDLCGPCLFLSVTSPINVSPCHPLPPTPPGDIWPWLALSSCLFNKGVKSDKGGVPTDCIKQGLQFCFAKPSLPE